MNLLRSLFGSSKTPAKAAKPSSGGSSVAESVVRRRTTVISRNSQAFHEERGWTVRDHVACGYYRTKHGSFAGRIEEIESASPRYFIIRPPKQLLNGAHGACFRQKSPHEFSVHWNRKPPSIDVGILRIEHAILESFQ